MVIFSKYSSTDQMIEPRSKRMNKTNKITENNQENNHGNSGHTATQDPAIFREVTACFDFEVTGQKLEFIAQSNTCKKKVFGGILECFLQYVIVLEGIKGMRNH